MPPPKKRKKGPTKRPKKKGPTKRPRLRRAVDSRGTQLVKGQRVRHADAVWLVDGVVEIPQDGGRVEIVYFRKKSDPTILSQIHLPLVTILRDGPRKRLSLRDRLRRRE